MFSRLLADVPLKEDWGRWKEAEDSLFFFARGVVEEERGLCELTTCRATKKHLCGRTRRHSASEKGGSPRGLPEMFLAMFKVGTGSALTMWRCVKSSCLV